MGQMTKEKKALGISADQTNPGSPEDAKRFSEIVYQEDGPYKGQNGGTFKCKGVSSKEELAEALESGWFATPQEAVRTGPSELEEVRREIEKLKEESRLESERAELAELRAKKAERALAAKANAKKTASSSKD